MPVSSGKLTSLYKKLNQRKALVQGPFDAELPEPLAGFPLTREIKIS
jgi:hypothetical protein